jgi:DNA modification methylase
MISMNTVLTPTATTIVMRALDEVHLDPQNPRAHNKMQIRQIAKSIEAFGFNVPILVDKDLNVIAGHGRVMACRMLGRMEIPTISLEHLTAAQARAFQIADNRLTENSTWDERLLGESLKLLSEVDLDFDLDVVGFEMAEIDLRIEQLEVPADEEESVELPDSDAVAVSVAGDLWTLGEHRVLCGNALRPADYGVLLKGDKANMVFTDPPYNVPIDGHATGSGRVQHREFQMASGEMSVKEFTAFLSTVCENLVQASTDGSIHFLCMDWRHLSEILAAGSAAYTELKNFCVWTKDNAGMGSLYRSQHELVLVFKNGTAPHVNNVQLGQFGRYRSNVWAYPGVNSFARSTEEGNLLELHPTVKPVAMIVDALFDCSRRGDAVLDSFLGSGSTLIAAERAGRRCYGMDLDLLYVDTAIRRWQRHTGLRAVHADTGIPFDEREQAAAQSAPATNINVAEVADVRS